MRADICDLRGAGAIKLLETERLVDVVLMDVHMPEMDGFETAKRIKKMTRSRDIPIIFVTAVYQDDPFVKRGYEVGGIDYFSKPFDPEILRMKIAAYAAFRQQGRPAARARAAYPRIRGAAARRAQALLACWRACRSAS